MKQLKAYDLACGGVQSELIYNNGIIVAKVELYNEHGVYHVRAFKTSGRGYLVIDNRLDWNVFDNIKDARKDFKQIKNRLKIEEIK